MFIAGLVFRSSYRFRVLTLVREKSTKLPQSFMVIVFFADTIYLEVLVGFKKLTNQTTRKAESILIIYDL